MCNNNCFYLKRTQNQYTCTHATNMSAPNNATTKKLLALEAIIVLVNLQNEAPDETIPDWEDISRAIRAAGNDGALCASYAERTALTYAVFRASLNGGPYAIMPRVHALFARLFTDNKIMLPFSMGKKAYATLLIKTAATCSAQLIRAVGSQRARTDKSHNTMHLALCEVARNSNDSSRWLANENAMSALDALKDTGHVVVIGDGRMFYPVVMENTSTNKILSNALEIAMTAKNYAVFEQLVRTSCPPFGGTNHAQYQWFSKTGLIIVLNDTLISARYNDAFQSNAVRAMRILKNCAGRTLYHYSLDRACLAKPSTVVVHCLELKYDSDIYERTRYTLNWFCDYNLDAYNEQNVNAEIAAFCQLANVIRAKNAAHYTELLFHVIGTKYERQNMAAQIISQLDHFSVAHVFDKDTVLSTLFHHRVCDSSVYRTSLLYLTENGHLDINAIDFSKLNDVAKEVLVMIPYLCELGLRINSIDDSIPLIRLFLTIDADDGLKKYMNALSISINWLLKYADDYMALRTFITDSILEHTKFSFKKLEALIYILADNDVRIPFALVDRAITRAGTGSPYKAERLLQSIEKGAVTIRARQYASWLPLINNIIVSSSTLSSYVAKCEREIYQLKVQLPVTELLSSTDVDTDTDEQRLAILETLLKHTCGYSRALAFNLQSDCGWPIYNACEQLLSMLPTNRRAFAQSLIDALQSAPDHKRQRIE